MGRHRKIQQPLPKYVYLAKGRYIYKLWQEGRFQKETVLCPGDAPISEVWKAYEALTAEKSLPRTLTWLIEQFLSSAQFKQLSANTQHDYRKYARHITEASTKAGPFGVVLVDRLTPGVIRRYVDKRSEFAPVQANRELSLLKRVFGWACERDMINTNPAQPVRRNAEKARDTYITDSQYAYVYERAEKPWYLRPAMEIAYLCRARKSEVLDLRLDDLLDEGLRIRRRKGSRTTIVRWSQRLRAAVNVCLNRPSKIKSVFLIHDASGQRILETTFDTSWQRFNQTLGEHRIRFHDIKAKGVTDDQNDKQRGAGHKSAAMTGVYDRKPHLVDPIE